MTQQEKDFLERYPATREVITVILKDMWLKIKKILFGYKPPIKMKKEEVKTGWVWKGDIKQ